MNDAETAYRRLASAIDIKWYIGSKNADLIENACKRTPIRKAPKPKAK